MAVDVLQPIAGVFVCRCATVLVNSYKMIASHTSQAVAQRRAVLSAPMASSSIAARSFGARHAFSAQAAPLRQQQAQPRHQLCRAQRSAVVVVRASWGAPVEFSSAKVIKQQQVATDLHSVLIDIGELAAGYTKPGQYVQVKVGDSKPGFFAIASAPDANNQGVLEFLIKKSGGAAELLCALDAGRCASGWHHMHAAHHAAPAPALPDRPDRHTGPASRCLAAAASW